MPDSPQSQVGGGPARVPKGAVVYRLGAEPCIGTGIEWTPEESRDALDGPVADVLDDVIGSQEVAEALGPLAQAEFDMGRIEAVAATVPKPSYRLGEAITEAYLSSWRDCTFPWPVSRDLRRPTASPARPDLVGLKVETGGHCLVLGEVKMSEQHVYPLSVIRGQSGLLRQLEDLRTDGALRRHLVRNLSFRWTGDIRERFIAAVGRYETDPNEFRLFEGLVQDVLPDERDLRHALAHHQHDRQEATQCKVLAIFLSPGHLDPVVGDSTADGGTS